MSITTERLRDAEVHGDDVVVSHDEDRVRGARRVGGPGTPGRRSPDRPAATGTPAADVGVDELDLRR